MRYFFLISLSLTIFHSNAQTNYGNEWINFSQKYLKIKVNTQGLYRISVNDVVQTGLVTQNINPHKFQLFNKGIQVPLFITGSEDDSFDNDDKIVFYGKPNDASLDKPLYTNANDLPNEEVSLYEDDNFYFLTYTESTTNNSRYEPSFISSAGLIPEDYIIYKSRLNFYNSYYPGEYILEGMSLSEYTEGEGYLGSLLSIDSQTTYNLNTNNYVNIAGLPPQLSLYVAGRSNALSTATGGNNHHLRVSIASTSVFDTIYTGYKTIRKTIPINLSSENTSVILASIDDLGAATDFQAPAYIEIKYPRNLNLNNSVREISFRVNNSKVNSLLSFSNANIIQPILLDLAAPIHYNGTSTNGNIQFTINNNQSAKDYFLGDLSNLKIPSSIENITFRNFSIDDIKSFLIISNKTLQNGVNNYLNYNHTVRNLPSSAAYVEDLYNEFYYGFHHPLALKNFCRWALDKAITKPEYLLLLGKGYEIPKQNLSINLVPTYGYPASDNLLTAGINRTTTEPAIAMGRIPAKNNSDIDNYLNKLRIYEQLPDSLWRKKIIHVTGGKTSSENLIFKNYLNNLYNVAKEEYFGASVVNFNKSVSDPVTDNITNQILAEKDKGTGLISFLGHGSAVSTEVSLGTVMNINNTGKPTIYIVNGCSTGNAFTATNSYGEQFVLLPDKGAIGWVGTTSEGIASYLYSFTNNFYRNWFNISYSKPIAYGIQQGIKTSTNPTDRFSIAHSRQYIFLGDPYLKFMFSGKPDYAMEQNSIYLSPANQNASQENLKFNFIARNLGKAINDSLEVKITRTLADNSIIVPDVFKIKPVYNTDTITMELNNTGYNVTGSNKLTVTLDPSNKFAENNKSNNQHEFSFFLTGNGVNPIFPIKNGITNELVLKAQPDNLFTTNVNYVFEIDTVASFDSGFKLNSGNILGDILPQWTPDIQPEDNKVYFWRVKINDPNLSESWSHSVFTYSRNNITGYSLAKKDQIVNTKIALKDIVYESDDFEFERDLYITLIGSRGDNVSNSIVDRRIRANPDLAITYYPESTGIAMAAYHPTKKGKIFSYPSPFNSDYGTTLINGYTGLFTWNTNDPVEIDSLLSYLNQLPNGYHVLGVNNNNCSPKDFPDALKHALRNLGLVKFELVGNGEPYAFWGQKGSAAGSATEYTADYSSPTDPKDQYFRHYHNLEYRTDNGNILTDKFGPALYWNKAEINYQKRASDILTYSVIGVSRTGTEQILKNNLTEEEIDLSDIDAKNYPYIKIKTEFKNSELRSVPKLNYWRAIYTPLTELTFNPVVKSNFHSPSLLVGDSLSLDLALSNISKHQNSDSVKVTYSITKQDNSTVKKSFKLDPLAASESTEFKITESTVELVGKNILTIHLEDTGFGDNYNFNNSVNYNFDVKGDNQEPKIDILFDGKRIVNGEIISPSPIIDISSIDENIILLQSDTSLINIYLKAENEDYKRVNFDDGTLKIIQTGNSSDNRLTVRYTPNKLGNGKYSLKVSSKDYLGNISQNDFLTEFEVINESTISHFYPYPNPVINSMRFVFTLTGSKIPDKIKIQILSQAGRVVREIFKEELGNLKIGNNISDFVWDCKDQFGDRLANGVYFYKVFIEDSSEDFKHRYTKGDTSFKNNIGKIYLLK